MMHIRVDAMFFPGPPIWRRSSLLYLKSFLLIRFSCSKQVSILAALYAPSRLSVLDRSSATPLTTSLLGT
jgi:hypothetical protein